MSDSQINWFETFTTINDSIFVIIGGVYQNRMAWARYNPKTVGALETVTRLRGDIEKALMGGPDALHPSDISLCLVMWNPTLYRSI